MPDEKPRNAANAGGGSDEGFLKTAAETIGSTMGKLVSKVGLGKPAAPASKPAKRNTPRRKAAAKKSAPASARRNASDKRGAKTPLQKRATGIRKKKKS